MVGDGLSYFNAGNGEAYVEGARLELTYDDGTKEWSEMKRQVKNRFMVYGNKSHPDGSCIHMELVMD